MKRTFLFATIASILSINAYAVSATVTSKDYVDTTRQATIPASGTNASTPGDTVVTYTDTAGTIGEREIYYGGPIQREDDRLTSVFGVNELIYSALPEGTEGNVVTYDSNGEIGGERGIYDGSNGYNSSTDADKLVTAAALQSATNLPEKMVTTKQCYQSQNGECVLWQLKDVNVYGICNSNGDCEYGRVCVSHQCIDDEEVD